MKKKNGVLLGSIIALTVMLIILPINILKVHAASTENGFEYSVSGTTAMITGYTGLGGNITVPKTINNGVFECSVTSIGDNVFSNSSSLTSINIPNSVTNIGNWAFGGCYNLANIEVDSTNKYYSSINGVLFNKLENEIIAYPGGKAGKYIIPAGVKSIGNNAFCGSKFLTGITIPNSINSIGNGAFAVCISLESVYIPNSVTSIDNTAFGGCHKLTNFEVDSSNEYYSSLDGVLFNKSSDKIVAYPGGKVGAYIIPDSVTNIESNSFFDSYGLSSVTIPNSVTSIGNSAFYYCNQLKNVTMGNGVTSIGKGAFGECTNLTSVNIPNSVTLIDDYAFSWCQGLTNLNIPNSVTSIGNYAFAGCSNLTDIEIPNSVTSIGDGVFSSCSNLKSIDITNNVTSIGNGMFSNCKGLTKITIPNSVISIGSDAFYGCANLTEIQFLGNAPTVSDRDAFSGCSSNLKIYYKCENTGFTNSWYGQIALKIGIEVTTPPTKVDYIVGESLDLNELVVMGYYNDGTNGIIPNSMLSISGFDSSAPIKGQVVTVTINGNVATFIVNILPKTYTVTFDSNGGSVVGSKIIEYNAPLTAPTTPIKTGYTFGGWYKEAGCINSWDFAIDKVTEDTTLYAKWTINSYTTTFNSQGGSVINNENVDYNSLITAPDTPIKTGYTFGGWYKEATCTKIWDFAIDKVTEYTTIYAKWTINNFTATFNSQGGSVINTENADYNSLIIAPATPIKKGYTFGGWYKEATCINSWDFAIDKVTEDTTLYAKWTINNYTATFNSQGGSIINNENADYNSLITAPATPIKTGYTFGGWYKEATCINTWDFITDKVITDTTMYAKWIAVIVAPNSVTNAKAISSSYNSINVTWNAVTGANGYEVFRATSSNGTYSIVARVTTVNFNNVGLATSSTYYYKVRSYKNVGTTRLYCYYWSNTASAKVVPSPVVNVKAVRASSKSIRITWNKVTGASGYEVFRSTASSGTYSLVARTSYLYSYYNNSGLTTGRTYYYKIRSYRTVGTTKVYCNYWSNISYAKSY